MDSPSKAVEISRFLAADDLQQHLGHEALAGRTDMYDADDEDGIAELRAIKRNLARIKDGVATIAALAVFATFFGTFMAIAAWRGDPLSNWGLAAVFGMAFLIAGSTAKGIARD